VACRGGDGELETPPHGPGAKNSRRRHARPHVGRTGRGTYEARRPGASNAVPRGAGRDLGARAV